MMLQTTTSILYLLTNLTSRFAGPVHGDLDGLAVDGHDGGHGRDDHVQVETLAAPAAPDDAEVVKLGHVVLHDGGVVAQLAAEVLVVADAEMTDGPVLDITEGDHFKCHGQSFVAAPVAGQRGAENIGAACLDQFPGVLSQDLRYLQ